MTDERKPEHDADPMRTSQGRQHDALGTSNAAPDAIDRAADEEVQDGRDTRPEGAAFPNPGGGAVLAPEAGDEPADKPDASEGAGDEMRGGGGSGPLPPGTARPLPDASGRMEASLLEPETPREGQADSAMTTDEPAMREPTIRGATAEEPADHPSGQVPDDLAAQHARENARNDFGAHEGARDDLTAHDPGHHEPTRGPEQEATMPGAASMHALGVEAGRNGWVLWVLGIAAILAGVLALAMPLVASLATNAVVAAFLLISGAVGLFTSFKRREGGALAIGFALSVLAVITGVVMLLAPLAGIVALSTLIVAFFAASGVMRIWYGIKNADMRGRGWLIGAGVLSLALALMLWLGFPSAALWLPGVLLAIDLIVYGAVMISLAIFGKPQIDIEQKA